MNNIPFMFILQVQTQEGSSIHRINKFAPMKPPLVFAANLIQLFLEEIRYFGLFGKALYFPPINLMHGYFIPRGYCNMKPPAKFYYAALT